MSGKAGEAARGDADAEAAEAAESAESAEWLLLLQRSFAGARRGLLGPRTWKQAPLPFLSSSHVFSLFFLPLPKAL